MSEEKKKISQMKMIIDFGDGVFREYFIAEQQNMVVRQGGTMVLKLQHPKFSERMEVVVHPKKEG